MTPPKIRARSNGHATAPPRPAASDKPQPRATHFAPPPARGNPQLKTDAFQPGRAGKGIQLQVPWYSQFQGGHGFKPGRTACLKASTAMAQAAGFAVKGNEERIQLAVAERAAGGVAVDPAQAKAGQGYIDHQLELGRPVIVGVSHQGTKKYNVDRITDHFVIITGRGSDAAGRTYYTFNDPATQHPSLGRDTRFENRFQVEERSGKLVRPGRIASGVDTERRYEVSMIRRNVGS